MTATQVEKELLEAIEIITNVSDYETVTNDIFDECSYTLFRGKILYAFTKSLVLEAMETLTNVSDYETVINDMFDECSYTLFRGTILYAFTKSLMRMQPRIADEVAEVYHNFLFLNFEPLLVVNLLLD
jgi:hypothetical protein